VKCSRGVSLTADKLISECADTKYDCIAVPGGMPGAKTIGEHEGFMVMLKQHIDDGKVTGAICAAPAVVLAANKLIPDGTEVTCHPGMAEKLGMPCSEERVVTAGKLVTSRGPGTAIEFALELVKMVIDADKAEAVKGPMLVK